MAVPQKAQAQKILEEEYEHHVRHVVEPVARR
jgi:hypothetical protein